MVAVTLPPEVVDPRSKPPVATAVTSPVDFTVPNTRSFVSLRDTVPLSVPPAPDPETLTAPPKSFVALFSNTDAVDPLAVSALAPSTLIVLVGIHVVTELVVVQVSDCVILPFEVALRPPAPRLTVPSSSGVLSVIVAPAPDRLTAPVSVLDAFAKVTAPDPESTVLAPVTLRGPV